MTAPIPTLAEIQNRLAMAVPRSPDDPLFNYRRPSNGKAFSNGRLKSLALSRELRPLGVDGSPAASVRRGRPLDRNPVVLIVDDCAIYRENLVAVFAANGSAEPRSAWDLQTLCASLTEDPPHVVLINLDTRDSAMLLQATFDICPDIQVVVVGLSEDDEAGIVACAEAGVAGYHLRSESLDDLLSLIPRVAAGESLCSPRVSAILLRRLSALAAQRQPAASDVVLTAREVQILQLLDLGLSNRQIAARLCIAVHTVKNHVHSVLTKLGVSTRAEAAARFRSVSLVDSAAEN